jgi:hypothetical protein
MARRIAARPAGADQFDSGMEPGADLMYFGHGAADPSLLGLLRFA